MKKALSLVLFLGLLLLTSALKSKKDSLVKRINNAFKMFSIANFVEEYTPSKYAEKLLDEDLEVDGLSIKIQLVRDSISAVLDHLGFEEGVILKVAAAKVSQLMDCMDLFVGIALGQKEAKDFVDLVGFIPDLTDVTTFNNKLKNSDKVKDAVDFIKDIIHPDSVVNKKPAARTTGKSSRKSKKILEAEEDSLVEANQKLNKDKEDGQELNDDLSTEDSGNSMKAGDDDASTGAALPRKEGPGSSDDYDGQDGDDNSIKTKKDDDDQDMKDDLPLPKRKRGDVVEPAAVVPATKRKLSHRKKEKNGRASKTNVLGNFVEVGVPTAKRITKNKKDTTLDTLLDDPKEPMKEPKPEGGEGEPMKEPKPEGGEGEPMKGLEGEGGNGEPMKGLEGEGNLDDDNELKQATPPATPEVKVRRMSGKKNQKIKGLTRKALKNRIKPSFMTEEEIKAHEKNELSDNFSFISLREDNKTGLKAKKLTKHQAKAHRKTLPEDEGNIDDDQSMKGKNDGDDNSENKLDEQLNDNDVDNDGGLKGKDDDDQGLTDITEETDTSKTPAARKAHKHRRF